VWRPQGLAGAQVQTAQRERVTVFSHAPGGRAGMALWAALLAWAGWALGQGDYARSLAEDVMVMALFGLSLQWMMALGGLVSFGHAAFFALGAYAAALTHLHWGLGLLLALASGVAAAVAAALVFGVLVVRLSGVYLAMLSLALAQMVWAGVTQWVSLTGGDNGLIGLRLVPDGTRSGFGLALCALVLAGVALLARASRSSRGGALQALRDARCGPPPAACRSTACATRFICSAPRWPAWPVGGGRPSRGRCSRRWPVWALRWMRCWSSCSGACTSSGGRWLAVPFWSGAVPNWGAASITGAACWAW